MTAAAAAQTIVVPYNDLDAVQTVFAERGDQIAAVITEPAAANMGVVPPKPGFNALLREVTAAHGAQDGDVVILSPACSSFDKFKNFVERGNTFRSIVLGLE